MTIASFRAGESISAGDAVIVSSDGLLRKALADTAANSSVAGLAIEAGSVGNLVRVNLDSIYESSNTYSPPKQLYLSLTTSGALVDYEALASGLSLTTYPGVYITEVGRAITSNKINIEVALPRYLPNPTSVLLLESSSGLTIDAILQEDGSTIKTENAT